jgi:hypothetical protein
LRVRDDAFVVSVDFGTLSARALVVRVSDGAEAGTANSEYAHGVIDRELPESVVRSMTGAGPVASAPRTQANPVRALTKSKAVPSRAKERPCRTGLTRSEC